MMDKGLSLRKTKIYNLTTVLNVIRTYGPISRAQISKKTKLSPTACTDITKTLIRSKAVIEVGEGISSGGRKPILLEINDGFGGVIGVECSGDFIQLCLYDLALSVMYKTHISEPFNNFKTSFRTIESMTKKVIQDNPNTNILAMTISVDGIVDTNTQSILETNVIGGEVLNYGSYFDNSFDFPVYVENDSNILAFAIQKNSYNESNSLVHLHVDTGIGAGVILDGKIMRGRNGYMGEIGHITMDINGPICYCGSRGCLEMLASRAAIDNKVAYAIHTLKAHKLKGLSKDEKGHYKMDELLSFAFAGDVFAKDLVEEESDLLYHAVKGIINLYDPEVITISGFGQEATRHYVKEILEKMDGTIYNYQLENRKIQAADLRDELICDGAAMFAIEEIFDNNIIAKASL